MRVATQPPWARAPCRGRSSEQGLEAQVHQRTRVVAFWVVAGEGWGG